MGIGQQSLAAEAQLIVAHCVVARQVMAVYILEKIAYNNNLYL